MPDQDGVEDIGGTLRLGSYPCALDKSSKAYELYKKDIIHERHRHRYEVNNYYRRNDRNSFPPLVYRHTGTSGI